MTKEKENSINKIVSVLVQLDEKSLLLIDSGAKLLAARQKLEIKEGTVRKNEQTFDWNGGGRWSLQAKRKKGR